MIGTAWLARGMKHYKASMMSEKPRSVRPHLLLIQSPGFGESAGSAWPARAGAAFSAAASFEQATGVPVSAASISAPTCKQHHLLDQVITAINTSFESSQCS